MNCGDFTSHSTVEAMAKVTTGSHPRSVTNTSARAMTYTVLTETTIEISEMDKRNYDTGLQIFYFVPKMIKFLADE
jgi:hypothetical protein